MSRKHNTKHRRTPGGYARRLANRGLGRSPEMTFYADLHHQGKAGRVTSTERKS